MLCRQGDGCVRKLVREGETCFDRAAMSPSRRPSLTMVAILILLVFGLAGGALGFVLFQRTRDDGSATPNSTGLRIYAIDGSDRLIATEVETGRELFSLDVGFAGDALLSPDGATLYVSDGEALRALDAVSGLERWRVSLGQPAGSLGNERLASVRPPGSGDGARQPHIGHGLSPFAVAPDGSRLYIQTGGPIQVRDAGTGELLSQTEIVRSACAGRFHPAPDGRTLYVVCQSLDVYLVVSLESGAIERTELDQLGGVVAGSAQSRDGRWLYVVSATGTLTVLDLMNGTEATQTALISDARVTDLLVGLAADDQHLYVGVSAGGSRFATDQVRAFDVMSRLETERIELTLPVTGTALTGAPDGKLYLLTAELSGERATASLIELAAGVENTLIVRPDEYILTLAAPAE